MDKILFVEDDEALAMAIEFSLKGERYEVIRVSTVKGAKQQYDNNSFDLVVLDVGLPDGNGYDLCVYMKRQRDIPVIFLTALDEEANIVMGLDIGGDDYITKPFRVKELLSRVKVQLRRKTAHYTNEVWKSGDIKIEIHATKVYKKDQKISLTNLEYKLLLTFMQHAYKTLTRDVILKAITEDSGVFFDENTLSVYIKRLRDKIENDPKKPNYIVTQRGLGYRWDEDVSKKK
ncbi:response regulator transcription factor [Peribacillus aracenensis]|uniref:response regulator transcription factor n=1 Tax=Peribacillus aracenensis TaxID=2976708 RepID=UPI0021A44924|nr:response regulator transcription factor [Peribacillus sp. BBB004]